MVGAVSRQRRRAGSRAGHRPDVLPDHRRDRREHRRQSRSAARLRRLLRSRSAHQPDARDPDRRARRAGGLRLPAAVHRDGARVLRVRRREHSRPRLPRRAGPSISRPARSSRRRRRRRPTQAGAAAHAGLWRGVRLERAELLVDAPASASRATSSTVGTAQGASNLYAGAETFAQSAVVGGLPVNGSPVWVRLSSKINGVFQFSDYSFTSYTRAGRGRTAGAARRRSRRSSPTATAPSRPRRSTPLAGDLLVAFVSSSGPDGAPETMTVAGGSLTWTLCRARQRRRTASPRSGRRRRRRRRPASPCTSTHTFSTTDQSLVVAIFSGAGGIGASAAASAASGGPSVSLTTTKAGSFVYARRQRLERRAVAHARRRTRRRSTRCSAATATRSGCSGSPTPTSAAGIARHAERHRADRSLVELRRGRDRSGVRHGRQDGADDHLGDAGRHHQGHAARRGAAERHRQRPGHVRLHARRPGRC